MAFTWHGITWHDLYSTVTAPQHDFIFRKHNLHQFFIGKSTAFLFSFPYVSVISRVWDRDSWDYVPSPDTTPGRKPGLTLALVTTLAFLLRFVYAAWSVMSKNAYFPDVQMLGWGWTQP
jgi:hypothetical protein